MTVDSPTDPTFVGGDMVFELFEGRAPRATDRIIQLANSGFYENIIFHRVVSNFVIQAGDPTGTGTGGSDLGDFDDQFHPDLQHNREGILSMAKSRDDTNDSQFFVTARATRILDSNHTVFGQLITGDDVRSEVQNVPTAADRPVDNVVITDFEIFVDNQNGVMMLSAPEGTTGTSVITVTASDGAGGTVSQTFNVTIQPDASDNQPYLEDLQFAEPFQVSPDGLSTFTISATDLEGDDFTFVDQDQLNAAEQLTDPTPMNFYFVDPRNGVVTINPANAGNLSGDVQITVGVVNTDLLFSGAGRAIDLQVVDLRLL